MKMKKLSSLLLIVLIAIILIPSVKADLDNIVITSYNESFGGAAWIIAVHPSAGATTSALFQSFKIINNGTFTLSSVSFWCKKGGSPNAIIKVALFTHSGTYGTSGVPGTLIATSDTSLQVSGLGTSYTEQSFTFSGVTLTGGSYFIGLYADSKVTLDSGNPLYVDYDSTSPLPTGNFAYYYSGSWAADSTSDLRFIVYASLDNTNIETVDYSSSQNTYSQICSVHPSAGVLPSALGQQFTVPATHDFRVTYAQFYALKYGSPVGVLKAAVYSLSGTFGSGALPNTLLETSNNSLAMSEINVNTPGTPLVYTFFFTGTTTFEAGEHYAILLYAESASALDLNNDIRIYSNTNNVHAGQGIYYTESNWHVTSEDTWFYVYGKDEGLFVPPDSDPPTFGTITANTTLAGQPYRLSCTVNDNIAVDKVIYSTNKTGSWTNETALSGSGTSYVATLDGTWTSTIGTKIQVKLYANDTANNWGTSSTTTFTITAPTPSITPPPSAPPASPTPAPTPRIIEVSLEPVTLYFRSDTYTSVGVAGYGLDLDHTNTAAAVTDSAPAVGSITYGFRVFLVTNSTSTELTSGTPVGQILLNGNLTGLESADWVCPSTSVILGYQALKVIAYADFSGTGWVARATYLSPVLITNRIVGSTWTFKLYVNYTATESTTYFGFKFDSSSYRSGIYNVIFTKPLESEIQSWRLSRGDYIGFILGNYVDVIGEAFYVLCLLGAAAVLYFRYGHFGVVAFFFTIFGGAGGLVWLLVPAWAAAVTSILVILGTSFIVWRVIR